MKLARWIFLIAGIYGVAVLAPGFFLERQVGVFTPPPVTHPEYYYGFYGSALAWQFVFFAIARDPAHMRPLMLICVAEKFAFFAACVGLYAAGRLSFSGPFVGGIFDGVWMALFAWAWMATGDGQRARDPHARKYP